MSEPIGSFDESLTEAEAVCHRRICEVLGLRAGIDCFVSVNGGKTDCAVWDIGYLYTGDQVSFPATEFHFRGSLELYNRDRRKIQVWLMRLIRAFPMARYQGVTTDIASETNVECLRIAPQQKGVGEIVTTELKASPNEKGIPVFTTVVEFDVVFNAGARATA